MPIEMTLDTHAAEGENAETIVEISAKANAYKSAIEADAKGENRWTKFLHLINSTLYIPEGFNKQK